MQCGTFPEHSFFGSGACDRPQSATARYCVALRGGARMAAIAQRLTQLGISLPAAPKPVAAYIPAVRTGNLIFISGQLPFKDGTLLATGAVPSKTSLEATQSAARQCVLN